MGRKRNTPPSAPASAAGATANNDTAGASGSNGTATAAKSKRPRKTEDEIIAECRAKIAETEAKIAEAETKKVVKTMGADNKPLAAALKALLKLRGWITNETYEEAFAQIHAKATRLAAQAAAQGEADATGVPVDDSGGPDGQDDDDEIPASVN